MPAELTEIEGAKIGLKERLVEHAENRVPELGRVGVLRDYVGDVGHLGYEPWIWGKVNR